MSNIKNDILHKSFIEDCKNMKIYFNYLYHQFKNASSFKQEELEKYHKAYVQLVSSWGDYNGSTLIKSIKDIVSSNKLPEERYSLYKEYLDKEIIIYNKVNSMRKHKQIKI